MPASSTSPASSRTTISRSKSIAVFSRGCRELHERGEKIDRVTVANELLRYNELESVDGLSYLVSLDDGLPHISNLDSYVKIVRDKATLRRIAVASQQLMNRALMAEDDPEQILAGAEETLLRLGESRSDKGLMTPLAGHPGLRGRPQRVSRSEQADQGHQHRLHQAGRNDRRPACGRADHSRGAAFDGQDGAGAEYLLACGCAAVPAGGDLLARNVAGVSADAHAVRGGARRQPAIPRRLSERAGAPEAARGREPDGGSAALYRRYGGHQPDGHAREAAAAAASGAEARAGGGGLSAAHEHARADGEPQSGSQPAFARA